MQQIAIAVRDQDLFLVATVVRAQASDVYVNWPRDYTPDWKPHTSYHASGQHHHKSFGHRHAMNRRQKPDPAFVGTANVVSFGVATDEAKALGVICAPAAFDEVFEIPASLVRQKKYETYVYVDLAAAGVSPTLFPNATVLLQQAYKDSEPWIVLSFLVIPGPAGSK